METPHDPNARVGQRGHMSNWQSPHGKRDAGLSDRLRDFVDRLGRDKTLPWVGLGLIADLKAAADEIDGKPEIVPAKTVEYDL
jgi:hypothetical protein